MSSGKLSPCTIVFILVFLLSGIPIVHATDPIWTFPSAGNEIGGVTVSSDGSLIAVGAGKIWLFSRKGELLAKEPFGEQVVFSPESSSLASSYGTTLYEFKRKVPSPGSESPLQKVWESTLPARIRSIDISDNGNTVVASVDGAGTNIYSSSGKLIGGDDRHNAIIRVTSRGSRIVGVSQGILCLYTRTGKCTKPENDLVEAQPDFMEITSTGNISVFNEDQRVRSVFLDNKTLRWTTRASGDITSLAMTPTGSAIITGTENGNIDYFDEFGNLTWSYSSNPANKQSAGITGVALSKEGTVAAAGSFDGKIFAVDSHGEVIWSNQTKDRIRHVAMSSDGSLVVAAGDKEVYAFSTSVKAAPVVRTTTKATSSHPIQSVTTGSEVSSTQKPLPAESINQEITAEPTVYSVIRTSTQSPLSAVIPLGALLVALLILLRG